MAPEYLTALATCIGVCVAIIALFFTGWQLYQVSKQLRLSNLTNVLSIESEINNRKETVDKINHEINQNQNKSEFDANTEEERLEAAVENWINSVDRLCFCIRKNYFPEKEWSIEYRDYILDLVRNNEELFGAGSRYVHIIFLNNKWKDR